MTIKKQPKEQQFFLTHFLVEPAPAKGYRKLAYMTATAESLSKKIFYLGFGTYRGFAPEYLSAKIKSGSLIRLPAAHKITQKDGVWMDSNKNVYITDKNDPFARSGKLIYNDLSATKREAGKSIKVIPAEKKEEPSANAETIYKKNFFGGKRPIAIYRTATIGSKRISKDRSRKQTTHAGN